jgi:hypothetical protein
MSFEANQPTELILGVELIAFNPDNEYFKKPGDPGYEPKFVDVEGRALQVHNDLNNFEHLVRNYYSVKNRMRPLYDTNLFRSIRINKFDEIIDEFNVRYPLLGAEIAIMAIDFEKRVIAVDKAMRHGIRSKEYQQATHEYMFSRQENADTTLKISMAYDGIIDAMRAINSELPIAALHAQR